MVYASSSSVYGMDNHETYSESDQVNRPVSLYAATKKSDELMDFISVFEQVSGQKAVKQFTEVQPSDVLRTYADISRLQHDFGYQPSTGIDEGIRKFYEWYMMYYHLTSTASFIEENSKVS